MIETDILIIGGGASGLFASLILKDAGKEVIIVESQNRIGKKLLTTGNGRCNITNRKIKSPYKMYHSDNPDIIAKVLDKFGVDDTINLFSYYGLPIVELEKGKMYPMSLQASSVVDIFLLNLEERKIPVYLNSKVIDIKKDKKGFIVETDNEENHYFKCNKILVACGGKTAPNTGSDGSLYGILERLGHRFIPTLPSIVQLKLDYEHLKSISGVRFDCLATIYVDNELRRQEFDEILFTDYGISGPAIYLLSREASVGTSRNLPVNIKLDLFSHISEKELAEMLANRFAIMSERSIANGLIGLVHKKLIPALLKDSGINVLHKPCESLTHKELKKLTKTLKNWTFKCTGTLGFTNAQAMIGGVDTRDINPDTLESKLVKGLFFAGEVMDVDGDCGGMNLQWAWSSAYVASINMTK
ncbi:MAG: NAD(P)/FAD-dependent oxidoreductase [Bacilli bacterium]|nr:NAD(P)/FAD-dependent oxidoreductase [Bacilli bacterium]